MLLHGTFICESLVDDHRNPLKRAGKELFNYVRLDDTKAAHAATAQRLGSPLEQLVIHAGNAGTWYHPELLMHLAAWCSPQFGAACRAILVSFASGNVSAEDSRVAAEATAAAAVPVKVVDTTLAKFQQQQQMTVAIRELACSTKEACDALGLLAEGVPVAAQIVQTMKINFIQRIAAMSGLGGGTLSDGQVGADGTTGGPINETVVPACSFDRRSPTGKRCR